MRNKRVAIVVVSVLAVVLVVACIVAAGSPMLTDMMRSMHTIPQH
jgi:hypothetical protein